MKKYFLVTIFSLIYLASSAQTPVPGKQEVEKTSLDGMYVTSKVDDKYLERFWEAHLKNFGKVTTARGGVYKASSAMVSSISLDPINIISKVTSSKGTSQIFMAIDLGNSVYATQGSKGYAEAELFLKQFIDNAQLQDDVRIAEEAMKDADKSYQKMVQKGERLKKDIEKTVKELETLRKDLETNIKEQGTSQVDVEAKKKILEAAKGKLPKTN
jgi:hypothetical protein